METPTTTSVLCPFCSFLHLFGGAQKHLLGAKREVLLALRSLIDLEIERTEQAAREGEGRKARRVKVD